MSQTSQKPTSGERRCESVLVNFRLARASGKAGQVLILPCEQ
jgi:hypothetical protein